MNDVNYPHHNTEASSDASAGSARRLRLFGRDYGLPRSRVLRIGLGLLLVILGIFGFLPILGFWMIPLGFLILSYEFSAVRRWRRRVELWWGRRRRPKV